MRTRSFERGEGRPQSNETKRAICLICALAPTQNPTLPPPLPPVSPVPGPLRRPQSLIALFLHSLRIHSTQIPTRRRRRHRQPHPPRRRPRRPRLPTRRRSIPRATASSNWRPPRPPGAAATPRGGSCRPQARLGRTCRRPGSSSRAR